MTLLQWSEEAFVVQLVQFNPETENNFLITTSTCVTLWDLLLCKVDQARVGQNGHGHKDQQ